MSPSHLLRYGKICSICGCMYIHVCMVDEFDMGRRRFGSCVERVYVHCPHPWEDPLFGKVVFNSVLMPAIVLRGQGQVKFKIDRRPLWCKRFDRGKRRNPALIY